MSSDFSIQELPEPVLLRLEYPFSVPLWLSTSLSLRIIMLLAEPWNLTKTKDLYRLQAPSYVFDQKDKGHLQKE